MKKFLSLILILLLIISQSGCGMNSGGQSSPASDSSFGEDWLLDTYCYIKIFEGGKEALIKDAFKYARGFEGELSRTIEGSAVSKINAADVGPVLSEADSGYDDVTLLISDSVYFSDLTDGRFDPTIGSVTPLWNFSSENPHAPAASDIAAALLNVGRIADAFYTDENGGLIKSRAKARLDFGAIAKGYIGDRLAEYLMEQGAESAIISLGGNIVLVGEKPGGAAWRVGIENPASVNGAALESRESVGLVTLQGAAGEIFSVVTSGTYERCFEEDGRLYHHILDTKTGYPVDTDLVSVTITGPSSCYCDALSTSCLILGSSAAQSFMQENGFLDSYAYVFLTSDGDIIASDNSGFSK